MEKKKKDENIGYAPKVGHGEHVCPPDSAGRLMVSNVPTVGWDATVGDIEKLLLTEAEKFETINYIYILDKDGRLKGVASIKDLFRLPKSESVRKITTRKIVSVRPRTDQEKVVHLALLYNLKSIPVVDKKDKFLGVVGNDTILSVMRKEASEDILSFAGVRHSQAITDNVMKLTLMESLKHRLPWLVLGLLGGILAARLIGFFENTLEQNIILAAFIPLIVYMGGAVEIQMVAFVIRDIAINPQLAFRRYFLKQSLIIFFIAASTSLILFFLSWALYGTFAVARVLGIALFAAILSSIFTGLAIPYAFSRFRMDPANASGPIATIVQDLLSIIIYFAIATILL